LYSKLKFKLIKISKKMNKIILSLMMTGASLFASAQTVCTPTPGVALGSFAVSDTLAYKCSDFNSIITIYMPDTLAALQARIDSIVINGISFGQGTGLSVAYNNGKKTIIPNIPFCAKISGTIPGTAAPGKYSTASTNATYKVTFSAKLYKPGGGTIDITEGLLALAGGLEIAFNLGSKCASINNIDAVSNITVTNGVLTLDASKNATYKTVVTNILGATIATSSFNAEIGSNKHILSTKELSVGTYILNLTNGVETNTVKFVVE
jgi:hypothetical protein